LPDGALMPATAPFGRRAAPLIARCQYGAYVVLRCEDSGGPLPAPGQFYMLTAGSRWGGGQGERPFLPRAFSVLRARPGSASPHPAGNVELEYLIEDVGPGTNRLCELQLGEELLIVGPLGRGFRAPRENRVPLLVGGGVGIAPLAIWQDALGPAARAPLLGFRDAARAQGAQLLDRARIATDDGSVGHHGFVTELLSAELGRGDRVEVYACGPPPMLESVRARCSELGVPVQLGLESGMACGFGACFGCVVPTRSGYLRLCVDGPVLDGEQLDSAIVAGTGH